MRNFFNGDGDNKFDFDSENEEGQEAIRDVEISIETDLLGAMELDLAEMSLNQQLLDKAMKIAKQDILWWLRKPATKMRRIERIYRRLNLLVMLSEQE